MLALVVVASPLFVISAAQADFGDDLSPPLPWLQDDQPAAERPISKRPRVAVDADRPRDRMHRGVHRKVYDHHSYRHGPDFHEYD
jgi:hypothetical protein